MNEFKINNVLCGWFEKRTGKRVALDFDTGRIYIQLIETVEVHKLLTASLDSMALIQSAMQHQEFSRYVVELHSVIRSSGHAPTPSEFVAVTARSKAEAACRALALWED